MLPNLKPAVVCVIEPFLISLDTFTTPSLLTLNLLLPAYQISKSCPGVSVPIPTFPLDCCTTSAFVPAIIPFARVVVAPLNACVPVKILVIVVLGIVDDAVTQ